MVPKLHSAAPPYGDQLWLLKIMILICHVLTSRPVFTDVVKQFHKCVPLDQFCSHTHKHTHSCPAQFHEHVTYKCPHLCVCVCVNLHINNNAASSSPVLKTQLQVRLNELLQEHSKYANLVIV